MQITDVKKDQVIRFHYNGGTAPGNRWGRVIDHDTGQNGGFVRVWDLDVEDYRTFTYTKVTDLSLVADVGEEIVKPGDVMNPAIASLVPSSLLIEAYNTAHRGQLKSIRWDDKVGVIVVRRRTQPGCTITVIASNQVSVMFRNEDNQECGLQFIAANPIDRDIELSCKLDTKTARDFASEIFPHFHGGKTNPPSTAPALPSPKSWNEIKAAMLSN